MGNMEIRHRQFSDKLQMFQSRMVESAGPKERRGLAPAWLCDLGYITSLLWDSGS